MRLLLRGVGWLCIAGGAVLALYLVYSLYWTGRTTQVAQDRYLEDWTLNVGDLDDPTLPTEGADPPAERAGESGVEDGAESAVQPAVEIGEAVAALEFERPGEPIHPAYEGPLFIVEGVSVESLKSGPGHYPSTAHPGETGNFAIAGHRTTYGAPFYHLDTVASGDLVHVTDRRGIRWTYEVVGQEIVAPTSNHVLGPDPLGLSRPMLTLTTCNPRWSNAERLIVFAQLVEDQLPDALPA